MLVHLVVCPRNLQPVPSKIGSHILGPCSASWHTHPSACTHVGSVTHVGMTLLPPRRPPPPASLLWLTKLTQHNS